MLRTCILSLTLLFLAASCTTHKYELTDGKYRFLKEGKYIPIRLYVQDDSVAIFARKGDEAVQREKFGTEKFLKQSLDVDINTVLFKFRPANASLPKQLTADFNGNVYLGYRLDKFGIRHQQTPVGIKKQTQHFALSAGTFVGMGATQVTPWTTNNAITREYSGLVFSNGISVLSGINNLTVGVSIGWDHLNGRDKQKWIYQREVWYGLTLGLNLN